MMTVMNMSEMGQIHGGGSHSFEGYDLATVREIIKRPDVTDSVIRKDDDGTFSGHYYTKDD